MKIKDKQLKDKKVGLIFILLAVASGFFTALSDIISKDYMRRFDVDGFFALYVRWLFCSLSLLPLLFAVEFPKDTSIILVSLGLVPLEIIAGYLYMKSLEIAESTLVLPFQSFTPVFIPPLASFMIGEKYSAQGLLGIGLVVSGSFLLFRNNGYIANADKKAIFYMLGAALIYAFSSVVGRYVILNTSPLFFSVFYMLVLSLILTPYFIKKYRHYNLRHFFKSSIIPSFVLGFTTALAVITHFVSVLKIETGYMISIKRTSVIFSVILGYLFLREKSQIKERFLGALLMTIGVFVIAIN